MFLHCTLHAVAGWPIAAAQHTLPLLQATLLPAACSCNPRRCQLLEWCDPATDAYPSTVNGGTCLLSYDPVEGRDAYIMMQARQLVLHA